MCEKDMLSNDNVMELDARHMALGDVHVELNALMLSGLNFLMRCLTCSMYRFWVLHCHGQSPAVHLTQVGKGPKKDGTCWTLMRWMQQLVAVGLPVQQQFLQLKS